MDAQNSHKNTPGNLVTKYNLGEPWVLLQSLIWGVLVQFVAPIYVCVVHHICRCFIGQYVCYDKYNGAIIMNHGV